MFYDDEKRDDIVRSDAPADLTGENTGRDDGAAGIKAPQEDIRDTKEGAGTGGVVYESWQEPLKSAGDASGQETPPSGLYYMSPAAQTEPPVRQEKKQKKRRGALRVASILLACAVVSGAASYGVVQYSLDKAEQNAATTPPLLVQSKGDESRPSGTTPLKVTGVEMAAQDIYAMAVNQVVGVNTDVKTNVFGQQTSSAVSGTGFFVSSDGYIATNYHVISYAVEYGYNLTVMTYDGTSYAAKIIGYEPDNDIAVIKIDATGMNAVTVGNNDNMRVGDKVYAVGNPLGELVYTMTSGIVSALDRVISADATTSINMFQIDAAVNSGNSGGPVYNAYGEVIGIASAKYASTGVEGLGFAIPINDAVDIINQLMTTGHVSGKPTMGITVRTVTRETAATYNMVEGAYVQSVTAGGPADMAGIKVGDIITALGDKVVKSTDDLKLAKKKYKAGDTATVTVVRDRKEMKLTITFGEEGVTAT
jgi:serine protease Do